MDIVVYGIVQSATLLLMAFGFSLVYGISRLPNFAHGALYVFTGFVAWKLTHEVGLPYLVAAPAALVAAGMLGVLIYQLVLKRIRGMEMSEVIATYAIGLLILEGLRKVGLRGTTHALPVISKGTETVFDVPVDHQRLAIVAIGFGVVGVLWIFTRTTRMGRAFRGVAQDEQAAMMLGIDTDLVATIAVALGSMLAGVAALVLLPLGSIVVQSGYQVLIYAIAVCVVGGLGSWAGTVLACFVLGFSQYLTVYFGKPHYQMVVMLVAIILMLVVRPSGLLGRQKELEERV